MEVAPLYRALGRRVAARRKVLELTQAQLANRVGFSRASIANIERGEQRLPLHQIYRLTTALGLSEISDLLPPLVPDETALMPEPVTIAEPKDGLNAEQRRQVERFYHQTEAGSA